MKVGTVMVKARLKSQSNSFRLARWAFVLLVGLTLSGVSSRTAQAESTEMLPIVWVHDNFTVDELGNAQGHAEIVLPVNVYHLFKTRMSPREIVQENGKSRVILHEPKIENVLRYLGLNSVSYEVEHLDGSFDDEAASIHVDYRVLGRAKNHRGHWQLKYATDQSNSIKVSRFDTNRDRTIVEFRKDDGEIRIINRLTVEFPQGTKNIKVDRQDLEINYKAPAPTGQANSDAESRPRFELDAKPQIMSALYKLYGNPEWEDLWVARSLFLNTTADTLKQFRVRFRLNGHSAWSPWKRCDTVYPGQLVADPFYPVIDRAVTELNGTSLVLVEVEYEYLQPDGKKVSEVDSARIKLLGMNDALWSDREEDAIETWFDRYSNAPHLIASFATPNDPVIHDVVGMVSKATGGQNATGSDEQAMVFLGTLYNLMRQNISYEGAAGGEHGNKNFQYLKYGRDVLRTRSGTCINLSIFYASVCEAAGLEPHIILVPGHAFVGVRLPASKQAVFVETTLCKGGTKETSYPFHIALEEALKKYQESRAHGFIFEVDLKALHSRGVNSPELPRISSNPLKDWDIVVPEKSANVVSPKLFVAVRRALENNNLTYDRVGETGVKMTYKGQEGTWDLILQTFENVNFALTFSRMPQAVPESQRPAMLAELTKLNAELINGNFELDKEGRICFRTTNDLTGGALNDATVMSGINFHLNVMKKQAPRLAQMAVSRQQTVAQTAPAAQVAATRTAPQQQPQRQQAIPVAAPAGPSLFGRWLARFNDGAEQIAHVIEFHRDGTYVTAARTSSGNSEDGQGKFTYRNGIVETVRDNGNVNRGRVQWINANHLVYITQEMRIEYHRQQN